jgi:hypothetical protein
MSSLSGSPTRRSILATSAAGGVVGAAVFASQGFADTLVESSGGGGGSAVRRFHVQFPDAALVDLRRRVAATRWPERETVADATQGVQLATMQALARYWATDA